MRKNCLYERHLGWVKYDEKAYESLYRERAKARMRMRRQGECFCPLKKVWQCDGLCEGCPHFRKLDVALNLKVGKSGELTIGEMLSDGVDYENICIEKMYYADVLKTLDEIMPQARRIGILRLEGKTDRQISEILGIPRTSIYRMLEKAKGLLKKNFEEN